MPYKKQQLLFLLIFFFSYHCAQVLESEFQADTFSNDAILTKIELKRSLQSNDSPYFLPIDVEASPDQDNNILLKVPKHASDPNRSTPTDALRPVVSGNYSYALVNIDGQKKLIGKDVIKFLEGSPTMLEVFSETNKREVYTIFLEKSDDYDEASPEAFNINVTTILDGVSIEAFRHEIKAYQLLTGNYKYADVNFDAELGTTFQWLRGDSPNGDFKVIEGAETNIYSTKAEDGGKYIKFQVTPVAMPGANSYKPYTSSVVGPIRPLFGFALAQAQVRITEIGNKYMNVTNNDYVVLHNPSASAVSLNGLYIGRDSSCEILEGSWSEFKALPNMMIPANGYYLISRSASTINPDFTWTGAIGSDYCVALTNSSSKPTSSDASNVIDFVVFGAISSMSATGEGGGNAPALSDQRILRRKNSCMNNPTDTNNNMGDFELIDASMSPENTYFIRNSNVSFCGMVVPVVPMTPSNLSVVPGNQQLTLTWTSVIGLTYDLYWSTTSDVSTTDTKITPVTTPYVHTGLTNSTTYYYVLTATNPNGTSAPTSQVMGVPMVPPPPNSAPDIIIASVGNKINDVTANDYVLLYNPSTNAVSLSGWYIGVDSSCSITNGFTDSNFKNLPSVSIPSHAYYLIARSENTLGAQLNNFPRSITTAYCVVITNSSAEPTSPTSANIIDYVDFTRINERNAYTRKGACMSQYTSQTISRMTNSSDFTEVTNAPTPKNSASSACP